VTYVGHLKGGDLEGVFLIAYGNRLETYTWVAGNKLQRIAFYDAPILVTSVAVIKSYLVIGDVHKGVIFLQASSGGRQITELGRVCQRFLSAFPRVGVTSTLF
jgi:cleavage and polyadenylation specificity factor subunit 1